MSEGAPRATSSARDPYTLRSSQLSQTQMGKGMPQYLCLEMHQSRALATHSLCRDEPAHSGVHLTRVTSSSIRSLTSVTLRYHCCVTR